MLSSIIAFFKKLFGKKKKVYNNTFASEEARASYSSKPRTTGSFLLNEELEPYWIAKGRVCPFPIPPVVYFADEPPKLPPAIRTKVGKALEGRFQVNPSSMKILSVLNDSRSSAAQITEAATKDPNLASRLLKTVNSAAFGLSTEITVVGRAIGILGLNTVRSLAMADAISSNAPDAPSLGQQRSLWMHAALTSACAYAVSRKMTGIDPGEAATAGLLVNMGKMLLAPKEVEKLSTDTKLPPTMIEGYGGSCFAETWGLPKIMGRILESSSTPFFYPIQSIPADIRTLSLVVGFSSFVARWYGFSNGEPTDAIPGAEFLAAIGWNPRENGRWIPSDVIQEMEKARISMEMFLK